MNETHVIGPAAALLFSTVVGAKLSVAREPAPGGLLAAPTGPTDILPTDLYRLDEVSQSIAPNEIQVEQLNAMTKPR